MKNIKTILLGASMLMSLNSIAAQSNSYDELPPKAKRNAVKWSTKGPDYRGLTPEQVARNLGWIVGEAIPKNNAEARERLRTAAAAARTAAAAVAAAAQPLPAAPGSTTPTGATLVAPPLPGDVDQAGAEDRKYRAALPETDKEELTRLAETAAGANRVKEAATKVANLSGDYAAAGSQFADVESMPIRKKQLLTKYVSCPQFSGLTQEDIARNLGWISGTTVPKDEDAASILVAAAKNKAAARTAAAAVAAAAQPVAGAPGSTTPTGATLVAPPLPGDVDGAAAAADETSAASTGSAAANPAVVKTYSAPAISAAEWLANIRNVPVNDEMKEMAEQLVNRGVAGIRLKKLLKQSI